MEKRYKKVMVFGVFDLMHEGHRRFLADAAKEGERMIVVVARDEVVRKLKGKTPRQSEEERRLAVAQLTAVSRAVLGDADSGAYGVIKKHQPDMICLGYDQDALAEDLEEKIKIGAIPTIPIRRIASHKAECMHTSLLTKKRLFVSMK